MKYLKLAAYCLTLMFFLGACKTTIIREGPYPGMKVKSSSPYSAKIRMNAVAILDKSLQKWYVIESNLLGTIEYGKKGKIAVESTGSRRTPTGTLEAWTVLRNRTDYPLQIEGRVQFFDAGQMQVEDPSTWQRLMLPPNATAKYSDSSLGAKDITYYYIEIREGR